MFKTERIILFKAKKAVKQNNNVNNKLLFQTQAYFANCKSKNNKELLQKMLLNPKFYPFRVYNYFNPAITGRWKFKEHIQFLEGLDKYGVNWKKICPLIKTRTANQVRSHAQKFFLKLKQVKDEQLGIDFTSDNINSIRDMINNIKSINCDYDLIKVFLYLSEKYEVMKKDKKQIKHKKELITEIDKNSGTDNNIKNENDINNNDIIINNTNQDMNISNDNNNNNFNNKNISISNNIFMSNIFIPEYFNNNLFFINFINNIANVNIYNNFSKNIMIQNDHLNNLTPTNNSIKNNNSNDFNYY
jgi:SHAQKYF class myb-like DNA-binding protein